MGEPKDEGDGLREAKIIPVPRGCGEDYPGAPYIREWRQGGGQRARERGQAALRRGKALLEQLRGQS